MKFFFVIFVFLSVLYGTDMQDRYDSGDFLYVCKNGVKNITKYKDNDKMLNVIAYSCLKTDMINFLAFPIKYMRHSEVSRKNAAYYATILFQKKLLYYSLVDNIDISGVRTPIINDYILSVVFNKFVKKEYTKKDTIYEMHDGEIEYKVSVVNDNHIKKIKIDKYIKSSLENTYYYW